MKIRQPKNIVYYYSYKLYGADRKVSHIGSGTYRCSHGFKVSENYDTFYDEVLDEHSLDKDTILDLTIHRL